MADDDVRKQEYALFRFSLIAALVGGLTEESPTEYIERIAAKSHTTLGGRSTMRSCPDLQLDINACRYTAKARPPKGPGCRSSWLRHQVRRG